MGGESESFELIGHVISGRGMAASHIRDNADEMRRIIGADLIEGSLNVVFRRPLMLLNENAIKSSNGSRLLWAASLNGIPVWLYRWRHAPLHIVECLSPVHLRTILGLCDGDKVRVEVQRKDIGNISRVGKLVWRFVWLGRQHWCYKNDRYYFRTKKWCIEFGATQRATGKNVRDLVMAVIKAVIKKLPGAKSLVTCLRRPSAPDGGKHEPYLFERLRLNSLRCPEERAFRQVQNLLNYTKTSGSSYSADQYPAGYHTIEINGLRLRGQRDPSERLKKVPLDFHGKTVLDIGCNQGGMLFGLGGVLRWGVGIDYDARMINSANRIKLLLRLEDLGFYVLDVEKEPLDLIEDLMPESRVDVVFLLSLCMWLKNWRDVVAYGARISDAMIFETNGTDEQQLAQEQYLKILYRNISLLAGSSEDDPKQKRRKLYYCREPLATPHGNGTAVAAA